MMVVLCMVSVVSLAAMENKKELNAQNTKKEEPKRTPELEFLMYPEDAHIEIDKNELPKDVVRLGNTFMVPQGMDARLIHPTLVPQRIGDFKIKNSNMTK